MFSPAISAIVILVMAALTFTAGFTVSSWRSNGEIERLKGDKQVLTASNNKCVADLKNVNQAVAVMLDAAEERQRKAAEAMQQARPQVQKKLARITQIRNMPAVPIDGQCKAIREEQAGYVLARHQEPQ